MGSRRTALALIVIATLGLFVPAAHAGDPEGEFVSRINGERSANGLGTLSVSSDLIAVARRHSQEMASARRIYHNDNLRNEVSGWTVVAENVGRGASVSELHRAFMESASHRYNILYPSVTQIGVGIAYAGGKMYVTQIFRRPSGASGSSGGSSSGSTSSSSTTAPTGTAPVGATETPAPAPVHHEPKPRTVRMLLEIAAIS